MGESRRRKQASENIKQISADAKHKDKDVTRGVTFPNYAEKYLGRDVIDAVKIMGEELAEYEKLVTEHNMPIHELVEDLGMVDFFTDYPPFVLEQAQKLSDQMLVVASTLMKKETYVMDNAHDKIIQAVQASIREACTGRPILAAVCQGILSLMAVVNIEREITRVESLKYGYSVATSDPLSTEKDFLYTNLRAMNDDRYRDNFYAEFPFLFSKQMSVLDKKTKKSGTDLAPGVPINELQKKNTTN